MTKNSYVGVLYKYARPEGRAVFEEREFGLITYLTQGKTVLATLGADGRVIQEYPVELYPLALRSSLSLEELHKEQAGIQKPVKKEGKSQSSPLSVSKFWRPLAKEEEQLSAVEQRRSAARMWYSQNIQRLEQLLVQKEERMAKKGVDGPLTKFIMNSKDLPKDRALWEYVAAEMIKHSNLFKVFRVSNFGIRFFVD